MLLNIPNTTQPPCLGCEEDDWDGRWTPRPTKMMKSAGKLHGKGLILKFFQ